MTEIALSREPPAAVDEAEIVVASNEELRAARLSGKRLLALWNALPDVEKRRKVGDRDALIDQLWPAVDHLGLRTKRGMTTNGTGRGSKPFSRGHIYGLLANPIYTGQIAKRVSSTPASIRR
jgi:hypothetical protein